MRTLAASLRFEGDGFISPGNVDCTNSSPANLVLEWRNETTGQSGSGISGSSCVTTILGTFPSSKWTIREGTIELAIGSNRIVISVSDNSGNSSSVTVQVERLTDVTAPVLLTRTPAPDSVDFPTNRTLSVRFNEEMLPASLTAARFVLADSLGGEVGAVRSYDANNAVWTLNPNSDLAFSTLYTVTIDGDVEDRFGGNTLGTDETWSFTTAANPDVTAPAVTRVSPEPGAECAAPDVSVIAGFDEPIDSASVLATSFLLADRDGNSISGAVDYDADVATLLPDLPLAPGTTYDATLTTSITDLAGNALGADFGWSFSTVSTNAAGAWVQTSSANAPIPRDQHTAVWTGAEMIVFGGYAFESGAFRETNSGGRYNPDTNAWAPTSTANAPGKRLHSAVWTGTEMIVWGGGSDSGARYDPATDTWLPMSVTNAPTGRSRNAAVWTGAEVIVWGGELPGAGSIGTAVNSGGRYNPATDTWLPMSSSGAPSPRVGMAFVWTGSELFVWGGVSQRAGGALLSDGARYNPATDSWTPLPATDARGGWRLAALWTGSEVAVWDGGSAATVDSNGFAIAEATLRLFDPVANSWRASVSACEPYLGASGYQAHWTGSELFVWANDTTWGGHVYDPATDRWEAIATTGAPPVRRDAASVWAGTRFVLWGGSEIFGGFQDSGYVFEK